VLGGGSPVSPLLFVLGALVLLPAVVGSVLGLVRQRLGPLLVGAGVSVAVAVLWWAAAWFDPLARSDRAMGELAAEVSTALGRDLGPLSTDPVQCTHTAEQRDGRDGRASLEGAPPAADEVRAALEGLGFEVTVTGGASPVVAGTRGEDSVRVTLDEGVSLTVSIGCVDHTRE
jgi:hypothetical protein